MAYMVDKVYIVIYNTPTELVLSQKVPQQNVLSIWTSQSLAEAAKRYHALDYSHHDLDIDKYFSVIERGINVGNNNRR